MINPRKSAVWSTTKQIASFSCTHIPKLRSYTLPLVSKAKGYYSIVTHRKCIAKQMINPRISAVWSSTKQIEQFSCTPRVQEVHTKAEVVHLTPCLLGLGYYTIVTHRKCIAKHMINPRISAVWSTTKPIAPFSCTRRVQEVHTKAEVVHLTPDILSFGILFNYHAEEMP